MKEKMREKTELARRTPETVNPFLMMRRFTKDMERMLENFQGFGFPNFFTTEFPLLTMELDTGEWRPQIEVLQKNGQFMVMADLPGLTKDDVKVEMTDDFLTISGERKQEKEEKREGFYRSERSYGTFYRQIPLPEGAKTDNATATFVNGVLEITIPTSKVTTPTRKLEIKEPILAKAAKATA